MDPALEPLVASKTILLTTYKRDGTGVDTPVSLAVDDGHLYFRTYDKSWKAKRLANDPRVEAAPCDVRGNPSGLAVPGQARQLEGAEARRAAKALAGRHRVLQGVLVPLFHKLARYRTLHYELTARATETGLPAG